jgi:hypothetical protein
MPKRGICGESTSKQSRKEHGDDDNVKSTSKRSAQHEEGDAHQFADSNFSNPVTVSPRLHCACLWHCFLAQVQLISLSDFDFIDSFCFQVFC